MSESAVFDLNQPIKAKVVRPEGDAIIEIKFPSDEQWIERSRRRKIKSRNLGNGKVQSIPQGPDPHDAELVNSLRIEGCAVEVDMYEAKRILDKISMATFEEEPSREGANLRIPMKALGVGTVHFLRVPTERDRNDFMELAGVPGVSHGNIDIYGFNLGGAAVVYDKLKQNAHGYAGAVPVVHKLAIINAAFEFIDKELEGDDENP